MGFQLRVWNSLDYVAASFLHNWPFLAVSVIVAVLMKIFLDKDRLAAFLNRHTKAGVVGVTAVAVVTPLCSCGTMAVILGMIAGSMSWAPIVAFMVASPLTSIEELVYSAGLFGWPFAWAFYLASIGLGLLGGFAAHLLESAGWLKGQSHVRDGGAPVKGSAQSAPAPVRVVRFRDIAREVWQTGRMLVALFAAFAFLGNFINSLLPAEWVAAVFGGGQVYGVPLAATLGLPLYINTEASLPLVRSMLDAGMSPGAALAFLISGAGTSIGAITGALAVAKWRVVSLVVGTLWIGAILSGYIFNLMLSIGLG
jgi:uncharacterized membrane protein YraQ (UPF0718 family)